MADIDLNKVRKVIEAALDGRPEGYGDRPELSEEETQVVDNYLTHGDDPEDLPEEVVKALAQLRSDFYGS
jgi:hypothetical protein